MISLLLILLSFGGIAPREQSANDDLQLTVRITDIKSYCAKFSKKPLPENETFFQVVAPTWSGTREQAEKLQKKWEKIGVLWFKNVRSEPLSHARQSDEG